MEKNEKTLNIEKLLTEFTELEKNKNKLYTIKTLEKYQALTIKEKGLEKITKYFSDYKTKNEKEKALIEDILTRKYYGNNTASVQKYILKILNS